MNTPAGASVQRALSFEDNPPLSVPLRFFLTAPLFAAVAAALLLWQGEAALLNRWSPHTLALTHLLVLGTLSMAMIGALLQILPVVAGVAVARVSLTGGAIHAGLTVGTLLLAAAFSWPHPGLFHAALLLLTASLLLFVAAATIALWRQRPGAATAVIAGVRLSLAALTITVVLGALLASAFAWSGIHALPLMRLTDLHALWGVGGWVTLLVIGIALQVVPMFMVTAPYPAWITRGYAGALFVLMAAVSATAGLKDGGGVFHRWTMTLVVAGVGVFAMVTLVLLARRKRPRADPTTLYWRTAMACLLLACAWWWFAPRLESLLPAAGGSATPLVTGVLLIAGFGLSAVNGMLYKIVPFLVWYDLQGMRDLPNVGRLIPEKAARLQYAAHLVALALLLAACAWPAVLTRAAGTLLLAASLGMWINLTTAVRYCLQTPVKPRARARTEE